MRLVASDWLRLFAILGSVVGLLLVLVDVTALHEPDAPGVIVLGTGASVLALSLSDPGVAVVAATAGGLAASSSRPRSARRPGPRIVGTRELRALAVAGVLVDPRHGLARPAARRPRRRSRGLRRRLPGLRRGGRDPVRGDPVPPLGGPRRRRGAGGDAADPDGLGSGGVRGVALVWVDQSVAPLVLPFDVERGLIAAVGAVSAVLGLVAAWIQDDLEHVVGYTIVADAGFVVLGLAVLEPGDLGARPEWILIFVVGPQRVRGVGRRDARRLRDAAAARARRLGGPRAGPRGRARAGSRSPRSAGPG